MKKFIALFLAALSILAMAPALSLAADLEPMDISISLWDIDKSFPEGQPPTKIRKAIEDKFNVTFSPMIFGWGDGEEKLNLWAATGTLPDITGGAAWVGSGTYISWVDDGVVRALPDDLSAYPNIDQYMGLPEVTAYQKNGKNYFFPRMTYTDPRYWCMDRGLLIRKDWLDILGLEMPNNTDDLMDVIKAFTEQDPGEVGAIGFAFNAVFPFSQQIASFGYTDNRWIKMGDDWKQPCFEETVIPLTDWCRTAYKNGWMDQDFASRATNDPRELFSAGRIGVLAYQNSPKHVNLLRNLWMTAQPDKDFMECVGIVPLQSDIATQFQEMAYWSETYVSSAVDDAKMERILMLMDYLYSDEGVLWTMYGEEGVDFYYDDNGEIVVTLPIDPESGKMLTMTEAYPDSEFVSYLAAWNGDMIQYIDPSIPADLREMCTAEFERRRDNWIFPDLDFEVASLDLPEKIEMTARASIQWSTIVADTSDTPTEELYQQALAEWNSQGYEACWQAVTAAARAMGK